MTTTETPQAHADLCHDAVKSKGTWASERLKLCSPSGTATGCGSLTQVGQHRSLRALDLPPVALDLGRRDQAAPGDLLGPQRTAVDRIAYAAVRQPQELGGFLRRVILPDRHVRPPSHYRELAESWEDHLEAVEVGALHKIGHRIDDDGEFVSTLVRGARQTRPRCWWRCR
jgi:hypothetical protein